MRLIPLQSSIVDLGCGYGRACSVLEAKGYRRICGVDLSPELLGRAKRSLRYTKLLLADVCDVPLPGGTFDAALSFGVVNCLVPDGQLAGFVRECSRLLRPGGFWFVNMYSRNDSDYFDAKYDDGIVHYGVRGVFTANCGMVFRHFSLAEFLAITDPLFDVLTCERREFMSMHQKRSVAGYSLLLSKPERPSRHR